MSSEKYSEKMRILLLIAVIAVVHGKLIKEICYSHFYLVSIFFAFPVRFSGYV